MPTDDNVTRAPLLALQAELPAVFPNDIVAIMTVLRPLLVKHRIFLVQDQVKMNGEWMIETAVEWQGPEWGENPPDKIGIRSNVRLGASEEDSRILGLSYMFGFAISDEASSAVVLQDKVVPTDKFAVPPEVWDNLADEMVHKISLIETAGDLDKWYAANKTVLEIMKSAPHGTAAHHKVEEAFKGKWRSVRA
jgi:hypothetical protein